MVYLSIILVILGIVIIIYSIFSKSSDYCLESTGNEKSDDYFYDAKDKYFFKRVDYADSDNKYFGPLKDDSIYTTDDEFEDSVNKRFFNVYKKQPYYSETTAVFYEDSSNARDYSGNTNYIDPNYTNYNKIRRIGLGRLLLENDGLNFYKDQKFYRFDFRKINEIKVGKNYLALYTRGSETVKLFVFMERSEYIYAINQKFRDYIGERI